MKLLIISGTSGSGKSIALDALEDIGYYCIDNLPINLLPAFAEELLENRSHTYLHAAVGIDARNLSGNLAGFPQIILSLKVKGVESEVIFLDADDATLIKRFSETRRRHPLSDRDHPLEEAIQLERTQLQPITAQAKIRIDTNRTNVHQLRDLIQSRLDPHQGTGMSILFQSFGFKHGLPTEADFVFDVRCLPNPHWDLQLRSLTGRTPQVRRFLESHQEVNSMFEQINQLLENWLPRFENDKRRYMTIAIGCTGGQHRSVYFAERLADTFAKKWSNVLVRHRELS